MFRSDAGAVKDARDVRVLSPGQSSCTTTAAAATTTTTTAESGIAGILEVKKEDDAEGDPAFDEELTAKFTDIEKSLKDAKLMKDKMTKELDKVPLIISSLQRKPYDCEKTIKWLTDKTDEQKGSVSELMSKWIDGKSLVTDLMEDVDMTKAERLEKLIAKQKIVDASKTSVEQSYDKYKTNVLSEFGKFKS